MGTNAMFDPKVWAAVPFHFWSVVFFVFGSMVGSFLNVCIYRMPMGLSVVTPPSHCPKCKYSIPLYLNVPLVTWLMLGGRCKNCGQPIAPRYFLVELLTGVTFLGCWLAFGHAAPGLAIVYSFFLAGLIAATFIDFEHYIIPDEITLGGTVVGIIVSCIVLKMHHAARAGEGLFYGAFGALVGAGMVYTVLRGGKLLFGRQKIKLPAQSKIVFLETTLWLQDKEIPYEEIFYRKSDAILLRAKTVELADRGYKDVTVSLSLSVLRIGDEEMNPEPVKYMEIETDEVTLPREAMGLGDVKFMGAIGAFLGWQGAVFSLVASSVIGAVLGTLLLLTRPRESSKVPYGPYIAVAAAIWVFYGDKIGPVVAAYLSWR